MKLAGINKILFITLSNVGDVILTLPVLSALKDNFPDAEIDVVVGPRPREIFERDPRISRVFSYDKHTGLKEKIDFIKKLRKERYDLAVDMRMSLIPILIGAKNRTPLILTARPKGNHKSLSHLFKLKNLGIKYKMRRNIYIADKDREIVDKMLEGCGVKKNDILIGVSASCRSPLKEWRIEGFIEVINNLLKERRYKIVLIGDDTQINTSTKIKNVVGIREDLIDLTGKTDLNELFALIERMRVLLTCDSACMHIASDLGVKVAAIFGPTDAGEYGPTGKDDIVIRKAVECSPCRKAVCSFNRECMNQIEAGEVLAEVKKLLGK